MSIVLKFLDAWEVKLPLKQAFNNLVLENVGKKGFGSEMQIT